MLFSLSPLFDLATSKFVSLKGDGRDGYMPHVHTPKRSGVDLDAPSPQCAQKAKEAKDLSSQEAKDLEVLLAKQSVGNVISA